MNEVIIKYQTVPNEEEKHEKFWCGFPRKMLFEFSFYDDPIHESFYLDKTNLSGLKLRYDLGIPRFNDWTDLQEKVYECCTDTVLNDNNPIAAFIEWLQKNYPKGVYIDPNYIKKITDNESKGPKYGIPPKWAGGS